MAFDPRLIDDLARRLAGSVPEGMVALRRDLEQNFKAVLQSGTVYPCAAKWSEMSDLSKNMSFRMKRLGGSSNSRIIGS